MKKIKILSILLLIGFVCYAIIPSRVLYHYKITNEKGNNLYFQIVEIDKCQYIVVENESYHGGVSLIHKENCPNHNLIKK